MKVCILSDSHDNRARLRAAVDNAIEVGAQALIHCGDVVAPSTLFALKGIDIPLHVIHGNNTGDLIALQRMAHKSGKLIHYYGQDAGIELAGRKIFMVHYPHYARAMACTGEWDIVCCGHNHKAEIYGIKNVAGKESLYLNPGSVAGVDSPPTYILGDLAQMQFEIHTLNE